eukprot:208677_1
MCFGLLLVIIIFNIVSGVTFPNCICPCCEMDCACICDSGTQTGESTEDSTDDEEGIHPWPPNTTDHTIAPTPKQHQPSQERLHSQPQVFPSSHPSHDTTDEQSQPTELQSQQIPATTVSSLTRKRASFRQIGSNLRHAWSSLSRQQNSPSLAPSLSPTLRASTPPNPARKHSQSISLEQLLQIVNHCKSIVALFPQKNISKPVIEQLRQECRLRFMELIDSPVESPVKGKSNATVVALDLNAMVSTHGYVHVQDAHDVIVSTFRELNKDSGVVFSAVQLHGGSGRYSVHSYRSHIMSFLNTVGDHVVCVYVTCPSSCISSPLDVLFHVVALEMRYKLMFTGKPFKFAFVSFPERNEWSRHAIYHVLTQLQHQFTTNDVLARCETLIIVDSNGDTLWDDITHEEMAVVTKSMATALREFIPIKTERLALKIHVAINSRMAVQRLTESLSKPRLRLTDTFWSKLLLCMDCPKTYAFPKTSTANVIQWSVFDDGCPTLY